MDTTQLLNVGSNTILVHEIAATGLDSSDGDDHGVVITLRSGSRIIIPSQQPQKLLAAVRAEWLACLGRN